MQAGPRNCSAWWASTMQRFQPNKASIRASIAFRRTAGINSRRRRTSKWRGANGTATWMGFRRRGCLQQGRPRLEDACTQERTRSHRHITQCVSCFRRAADPAAVRGDPWSLRRPTGPHNRSRCCRALWRAFKCTPRLNAPVEAKRVQTMNSRGRKPRQSRSRPSCCGGEDRRRKRRADSSQRLAHGLREWPMATSDPKRTRVFSARMGSQPQCRHLAMMRSRLSHGPCERVSANDTMQDAEQYGPPPRRRSCEDRRTRRSALHRWRYDERMPPIHGVAVCTDTLRRLGP